ncbi:YdcF family protein [Leptotrichia wadei]|uniref:YdcF family protein n=1 Tax=Leptotrichia wadei TaxID=157687 RepID=UPI0028D8E0F9|nr:YdcF family protein [Leptotrichia wadei]
MKNTIITVIKSSIIIFIFLFFFVQYFIIKEYINDRKAVNENKKVDYVIILGARVKGEKPAKSLMERIKAATKYLKKNPEVKVIATGGKGKNEGIAEGVAIKRELLKNGISEDRIILEDKSKNTVENFRFSLEKIRNSENGKNKNSENNGNRKIKVLIVTNDYHIFRSKNIARKAGFDNENYEIYGLPAKTPLISIPKSYFREFLSNVNYFIFQSGNQLKVK